MSGLPTDLFEYLPDFLEAGEAEDVMATLIAETTWEQHRVRLFGRWVDCPRLSAWHGEPEARYAYSGTRHDPRPWTPVLAELRDRLFHLTGARFNSVLLNRYRSGEDAMGWHADDEPELGPEPVIASLSLGARRKMRFRRRGDHRNTDEIWLDSGSLLVMKGRCQAEWQHALPRSKRVTTERINLTYRRVLPVTS